MYFETTIKGAFESDEGLLKIETKRLLLEAETFADAEEKTYKFWEDYGVRGGVELKTSKISNFKDVRGLMEDCSFFRFVTRMIIVDDRGKEKKLDEIFLIGAKTIEEAEETGRREFMADPPWPVKLLEVKLTGIHEVDLPDSFEDEESEEEDEDFDEDAIPGFYWDSPIG